MAKNITIAEDGVSRNFTAKKLKTNLQGGGTCTWIPEDEAVDYVDLKELKVTANGTYKAEDKNCDGFYKVKVNVPTDVIAQKVITANGEYDAMEEAGKAGYAHVSVNVPGGGGGPFTVLFLDDEGNVLKKQENVPYGGYASCTALDGTILNGLYFKGWNPVPNNVQFNMTCRPVRGDYIITPGEILDDWETIVADGGAHYPLGAYKPIVFTVPAHAAFQHIIRGEVSQGVYVDDLSFRNGAATINAVSIACHMVKVAEGEDGSRSSWVSDGFINFGNIGFGGVDGVTYKSVSTGTQYYLWADWLNSPVRKWLNEDLLNSLPDPVKNHIVNVNKTSKALNCSPEGGWARVGSQQLLDKTSIDGIWVPSMKEYHTKIANMSEYSTYSQCEELSGIDYSAVFSPIMTTDVSMRSLGARLNASVDNMAIVSSGTNLGYGKWAYGQFGFCL